MNPDYLPLLAEIGIAVAGFGGLAGLIGRRNSAESAEIDVGRLRGMLERSLSVVLLALLPMALGQFPISDAAVWWTCGVLLFVASPALHASQRSRLRRLPDYASSTLWIGSRRLSLMVQLGVLGAGFLGYVPIASAFGLALLIELAIAGSQFLRVIASVTSRRA